MTKFNLAGKTAIVTGGGSGIGRSIVQTLAAAGAHVHILDVNPEQANETISQLTEGSGSAHHCDVTNQEIVCEVVGKIAGGSALDILVNNAGVGFVGNVEQTDSATFDRLFDINVKGVYNCLFACVPHMKRNNNGATIINMASTVSTVAIPDRFAYTATKGAVLTMTYSLALDYIAHGIRCNAISPARVHTPFVDDYIEKNYPDNKDEMFEKLSNAQPIGRMARPQEIADLALYLCSDEAAFVTGQNFNIDGGFGNLRP